MMETGIHGEATMNKPLAENEGFAYLDIRPEAAEPFRIDYKGTKQRGHDRWNYHEFIAFDGEGIAINEPFNVAPAGMPHAPSMHVWDLRGPDGKIIPDTQIMKDYVPEPQPYVLLANSKNQRIARQDGLSTIECFEFLLNTKVHYPNSKFVGFGFNYDVNQMLRDLPERKLIRLHESSTVAWRGYWIKWLPRKSLIVKHKPTKRSMILYDVFGYFQKSFYETCIDYLGADDPQLALIARGKAARELFTWEELEEFIVPYNAAELQMLVRIMNILRNDLHAVGVDTGRWHGPGAIANKVFALNSVPITRETPEVILDASQFAYAGGRFELYQMGRHPYPVYEYDIHSAYPAAATLLPDISRGSWEHVTKYEPDSFGIWYCNYRKDYARWKNQHRPKPLFCRSQNGSISYPSEVESWYWTPEAALVPSYVQEGYVFRPDTDERPFEFIKRLYDERRVLKSEKNPAERAVKLILNSIYGKMAQTVGGDDGPPQWHQLEYAGFITSYTRAQIYRAILLNPDAIIASETDAVFSTEPLDLPLTPELGDWEEEIFDEICYLQSGFYYARQGDKTICRYRGMDKDRNTGQPQGLPYNKVLEHLQAVSTRPKPLRTTTTRFIGLGMGLYTNSVWRSWEKKERSIHLHIATGKRIHQGENCPQCRKGLSLFECLHRCEIGGYSGKSYARAIPWRTIGGLEIVDWTMSDEMTGKDYDRWN